MKEVKGSMRFKNHDLVSSLILAEMAMNDSDAVSVVCKDGDKLAVSKILLAVLSPYLAKIMKTLDCEDFELHLPDIESLQVRDLIKMIVEFQSGSELQEKILQNFQGILWKNYPVMEYEDNDFYLDDPLQVEMLQEVKEELEELNEIKSENKINDSPISMKKCSISNLESVSLSQENESKSICKVEVDDSSDTPDKDESPPSGKSTRKRKALKDLDPDFSLTNVNRNFKGEDQSNDEEDSDFKPKRKKRGPYKKRKPKEMIIKKESEYKSQELDEPFRIAQEQLKDDMQDINNVEDPTLLWYKYHGLDHRIYSFKHQVREPKMTCPVCYETFPSQSSGKGFFSHLREHKVANFSCPCKPKTDAAKHLKIDHWKFIECSHCDVIIDSSRYHHHLLRRHPEVDRTARCHFCGFETSNVDGFKEHMDKQHYQVKTCKCKIKFESRKHREHHLQKVHLKEKLACDKAKCYFLCDSPTELEEHKNNHTKFDVVAPPVVCDICGEKAKNMTNHKRINHDPVMLDCPACGKKFNAYGLKLHMKKVHTQQVCTICGAKVKCLTAHHASMHTSYEDSKYKCDICKRGFSCNASLRQHMMNVHLKERPYNCRYGCNVAYNDVSNRNQHEKRRHGQVFNNLKKEMDPDIGFPS